MMVKLLIRASLMLCAFAFATDCLAQPNISVGSVSIVHADCFAADSAAYARSSHITHAFEPQHTINKRGEPISFRSVLKETTELELKTDGDCAAQIVYGVQQKVDGSWKHLVSVQNILQADCGLSFHPMPDVLVVHLDRDLPAGTYKLEFQDMSYRVLETMEFELVY